MIIESVIYQNWKLFVTREMRLSPHHRIEHRQADHQTPQ
eukprot:SAG31_NODE_44765_length_261_cov_0.950617_1_plen_38_part_10